MLPFPYLVFRTVIDQGTFNKAALVLNVTPSAISHSVNQLETELGFPVFVRSRNGVKLTPDGEKVLPLIQEIINDQSRLEQVAQQIQGLDTGLIRIGAFSSACINWLPPLIQNFTKNYPPGQDFRPPGWLQRNHPSCKKRPAGPGFDHAAGK